MSLPPPAFSRPLDGISLFSVYYNGTCSQPNLSPGRRGGRDHVRVAGPSGFGVGGCPSREGRRFSGLRQTEYLNDIVEQDHAGSNAWSDRGRAWRAATPPVAPSPATTSWPRCARGRSRPFPPTTWPPSGPSSLPCSVVSPDVAGQPVQPDHAGTLG